MTKYIPNKLTTDAEQAQRFAENEVMRKRDQHSRVCQEEHEAKLKMERAIALAVHEYSLVVAKLAIAGERLERAESKLESLNA